MAAKSAETFKDRLIRNITKALPAEQTREVALDTLLETAILKAEEGGAGQTRSGDDDDRVVDQAIGAMGLRVPGEEEVKTGPAQSASGAGVERMIREYSRPDPQQDVVVAYEKLSKELGSMRGYMKSMAEVLSGIVKAAAEEDKHEDEKKPEHEKDKDEAAHKAMADEFEEDDDEDGEHKGEKAKKAGLSGPALAASTTFQAAQELDGRARAARKAGDSVRAKTLRGKVEKALGKAIGLLETASDRAEPAAKAVLAEIHAMALLKGFAGVAGIAAAAESQWALAGAGAAKADALADEAAEPHGGQNQTEWATGHGKGSEPATGPTMDSVLKGLAVLNGNVAAVMDVVAGKARPDSLKATDLGLLAKSAVEDATGQDPAVLFKSKGPGWIMLKKAALEGAEDSGEMALGDILAAQDILGMYQGVVEGAIGLPMLKARVSSSSETVRALFSEVLAD